MEALKLGFWSRAISCVVMLLCCALAFVGCSNDKKAAQQESASIKGTVSAAGSTALLPLLKPAQEEFQKMHAEATVNISGGGSFTGINQVASGAVQIGNADIDLPQDFQNKGLVDHKVVVLPFVFITNPDVKVEGLTAQQTVDILTGKITNWKEVGGADQAITLIHRSKSSGSRQTVQGLVLKDQAFTDNAVIQDSNGAVKAAVAKTSGAVGYVDAPYADNTVKVLNYDGVKYSAENVMQGKYPIYSYGHMYTKGEAKGTVKAFIDYVTSAEFQNAFVEKNGFIPITKMKK